MKNDSDNKMFWKTIKPFLSDKVMSKEKIAFLEENEAFSSFRYLFFKHCRQP